MIEKIFQRLNKANQILGDADRRAEYDAALASHERPQSPRPAVQASQGDDEIDPGPTQERKRGMAFTILKRRGDKLESAGETLAAAKAYRNAFALQREADVARRAAELFFEASEREDSAAMARAVLDQRSDDVEMRLLLARIHEDRHDFDRAVDGYRDVLEHEPGHAEAKKRLQRVESLRGDT
jgi:curved DNA-binding protein CbpA